MKYNFPIIRNITDVLPAIEGSPEFIVADRGGYKVVNYNVSLHDTFPPINESPELEFDILAERNKIRRECRGIIFCSETGNIIRRPFHKFFNVGEREEVLPQYVNLSNKNFILEKLDGSMIAPFIVNGDLIFGTKMGATDVAKPVTDFVNTNDEYLVFSSYMIESSYTPIFEWCSRKQRIVLDHPEDQLILTALRHMETGEYVEYRDLVERATYFDVPVVKAFEFEQDLNTFIAYTKSIQDAEGFVVRFVDGHMVKCKSDWYVQIHKAKEKILYDRHIVDMILENTIDDIKPHLLQEDLDRLEKFEEHISYSITILSHNLVDKLEHFNRVTNGDRKTFALEYADSLGIFKPIAFKHWDIPYDLLQPRIYQSIIDLIKNHLGSNTKYETIKEHIFKGIGFND